MNTGPYSSAGVIQEPDPEQLGSCFLAGERRARGTQRQDNSCDQPAKRRHAPHRTPLPFSPRDVAMSYEPDGRYP